MIRKRFFAVGLMALGLMLGSQGYLAAQKYGGVLRTMTRANPTSLSPHETASSDTTWTMSPVYNTLVWFDALQDLETPETLRPDLAESWRWSNGNKDLTFKLKRGVRFHDGKPFTGKDVKHTFDVVRGASKFKLKLNPSRLLYFNVQDIVTNGDYEVTFKLKRPQPSLLTLMASGRSPIYPAHVDPAQLRITAMGTGPFKLKEFKRDQKIVLEKNKDYFVKGRPYLDGITYVVIKSTASRNAALIAGQVDADYPSHTTKPNYENLKRADVGLNFIKHVATGTSNVIVNTRKAPFNNLKLRQAINLAMDRKAFIKAVFQGGAVRGSAMIPHPHGLWGLSEAQLDQLPGYGDPAKDKAEARRLLAEAGYGPANPLKFTFSTRALSNYVKPALWAIGEFKKVGIDAVLEQVDTGLWYGKVARRDFQIAMNATAVSVDDPDAQFYENFKCGSQRNYTDYCNPEVEKMYDAQSQEFDFGKRRKMVQAIDIRLQQEVARPYLRYGVYYYAHYPYVKNWIPHTSTYNCWRMQEVWLDK